jgi:hypothetical protein
LGRKVKKVSLPSLKKEGMSTLLMLAMLLAFLPSIALASEIPSPDSLILDENGAAYPDGATINITVLTYKVTFNRNGGDTDVKSNCKTVVGGVSLGTSP